MTVGEVFEIVDRIAYLVDLTLIQSLTISTIIARF